MVKLHDDPECLPSSGTLRRIRWPLQPRSRDDGTACATTPPLDAALASPWAFAGLRPFPVRDRLVEHPFETTPSPKLSHRRLRRSRPPFTRTARSFWSARPGLFEARCSPADFCNCVTTCGHLARAFDPRRDGGLDLLPFLTRHADLSCESGDARRAALRPPRQAPVPVPPACAGLPDRDTWLSASPTPGLRRTK